MAKWKRMEAVVLRNSTEEKTVALVNAQVDIEMVEDVDDLFGAISDAVTLWLTKCPDRLTVSERNSFNIGDMSDWVDPVQEDMILRGLLEKHGVRALTVVTYEGPATAWDFDDSLRSIDPTGLILLTRVERTPQNTSYCERPMSDDELIAYVDAVNRAHLYANDLYPKLRAVFRDWVGERVFTTGGQLLSKATRDLPELCNGVHLRAYRYVSDYSLAWKIWACTCILDANASYEITVYVANVRQQVLTELVDTAPFRTDYTVQWVKGRQQDAKDAYRAWQAAKSACWPFPEY